MPLTLDQFRATAVECADLGAALSDEHWETPASGRIYLGSLWIQERPSEGWPNGAKGRWFLLLDRRSWLSDDLPRLEALLYEWAVDSDFCDAVGEGPEDRDGLAMPHEIVIRYYVNPGDAKMTEQRLARFANKERAEKVAFSMRQDGLEARVVFNPDKPA